jgi:hypothetical protein
VVDAGVDERFLDPCAVDRDDRLVGVLLDDREQVAEQAALDRRQLGAVDGLLGGRAVEAVDLDPGRGDQGVRSARPRLRRGAIQPLDLGFALLLRNRRPSSYRLE